MEATKERMEKEQKKKRDEKSAAAVTNEAVNTKDTVRGIIQESVVEGGGGGSGNGDGDGGARKPEDILAFSRTVRKTDSSLE
ncbi:unnamed protein product [Microthlaspi erraticum]|uniref:Uncharacterized protein n=1 Tax=Microthlaspi erraticum TaxID=1685480 RepID=A0A6D2I2M9_9BRAS|nr:unnamed protein product [Microthlaspi erraticum]